MGKKLYQVDLTVKWFLEADTDLEAESRAVEEFCLEETPSCSTFDIKVKEFVAADSIKADKTLVTLTTASELVQETDSPKMLIKLAELVKSQVCHTEEELYLAMEIQKEIRNKVASAHA